MSELTDEMDWWTEDDNTLTQEDIAETKLYWKQFDNELEHKRNLLLKLLRKRGGNKT